MVTQRIDLTGGEAKVIGNRGDTHLFRLGNPDGQAIIASGGEYEAEFTSSNGSIDSDIELDLSEVSTGVLILPVFIRSGTYRVRRLNPRRTLLTLMVEVQ